MPISLGYEENFRSANRKRMIDHFLTLKEPSEGYYMDRGSKFLSFAFPIENEAEAIAIVQKIRKANSKARHFCTAWRIFPDASLERSADDGEPSGSAGKQILGQLVKHDLTNVMIVVVRYFGGTKLGIPGLIEAYKTSAANAILDENIIERKVLSKVHFRMKHEAYPKFMNYCKQAGIPILKESFDEKADFILCFNKSDTEKETIKALKEYSMMDFLKIEDYLTYLEMTVEFLPDSIIV